MTGSRPARVWGLVAGQAARRGGRVSAGDACAAAVTAVEVSGAWLIAVALAGIYFVYSAIVEERNLTKQFPDAYTVYRRSTKMLVPCIF